MHSVVHTLDTMHSTVHMPEHSAMHSALHTLDTRTRPCIRPTPKHSAVHMLDTRTRPHTPDTCTGSCTRPTQALGRAHARHAHSTVHTPKHTHSLAQVTLDLLCSTLSYMKIMFCFYLYTSRLPAGLTMWDNSQFLFFFIFSSSFILT